MGLLLGSGMSDGVRDIAMVVEGAKTKAIFVPSHTAEKPERRPRASLGRCWLVTVPSICLDVGI